jgi:hypothetical protein
MITRRHFLRTGALAGAGLLTWERSVQGQPTPTNLTGAWRADDDGIYYIRHLEDNNIWWAGLHNSRFRAGLDNLAFHLGVRFTNVFRGVVDVGNRTIEGTWADVPRGSILQHGQLSLGIETPSSGLELRQKPEGTTGGFGGKIWTPWLPQDPVDINYRFAHVRRGHHQFSDDNFPFKDFAVVLGKITSDNIVYVNWQRSYDYCNFVKEDLDDNCLNPESGDPHSSCDGDLNFSIHAPRYDDPRYDAGFWSTGWINSPVRLPDPILGSISVDSSTLIQRHLPSSNYKFHCEVAIFGRTNNEDDCGKAPNVLLPGWSETEGDSVLLNGRPVNGDVWYPTDARLGEVRVLGIRLCGEREVRITGVINLDEHAMGNDAFPFSRYIGAPEIHPVYSIDIRQDFTKPRPGADLTGVWHGNDVGTYYLRQVDENTVWWLGLSRDQGRSFANVFKGNIRYVDNEGVPLPKPVIVGEWTDIPVSVGGALSHGRLRLIGDELTDPNQFATATKLTKSVGSTGGFGASSWEKLYDGDFRPPSECTDGETLSKTVAQYALQ